MGPFGVYSSLFSDSGRYLDHGDHSLLELGLKQILIALTNGIREWCFGSFDVLCGIFHGVVPRVLDVEDIRLDLGRSADGRSCKTQQIGLNLGKF